MALTDKQELFAKEYIVDLNATQAAIRAGYSPKTAYSIGEENLRKPEIESYIQQLMDERSKRTEITADKVLKEYAKIGFADIKDFLKYKTALTIVGHDKETGNPVIDYASVIEMKDSDEVDGTLINEVSVSKDGTLKFKLHDKKGALDSIARHLGMFTDNVNTKVTGGMNNTTQDITGLPPDERRARIDELNRRRGNGASTTA